MSGLVELPEEMPGLSSHDERETWMENLLELDLDEATTKVVLVHDVDSNMVIRLRYDNGLEEMFDVAIRRRVVISEEKEDGDSTSLLS